MRQISCLLLFALGFSWATPIRAEDNAKAIEFFEAKIRPVLVEQCLKCHSEEAAKDKKLRGGLKLDSKPNWMLGGDTGPALVPGKPKEGTLLASLKYDGETQMPPKGKLPESVIADFEKWIAMGAVDPRDGQARKKPVVAFDFEKARQFWAFQPPKSQPVPVITDKKFTIQTLIDAFVVKKWNELGLKPNQKADKRTLIRRAYFDLIGLPPTAEEIEAFEKDESPNAFAKIVEKLLASPQYGERWARHWLDVARYAEDQAHTFDVRPKGNAYFYRDWVIKAFNSDMPYNRFVQLQIAGDLLPAAPDTDLFTQLAGLGYLGLGAEYYKNTAREQAIAEELDDRVDTLTRGFLGLTVSCARCHDHKFDPIPTRDYYSIAGIYYGTNLTDAPLVSADVLKVFNDAQKLIKDQEEVVNQYLIQTGLLAARSALPDTAKYLMASRKVRDEKLSVDKVAQEAGLNKYFLDRWVKYLDPANAAKVPAEFKEWFTSQARSESLEFIFVAASLAEKIEKIEVPEKGNKPAKGQNKPNSLMKAMVLDDNAPYRVPPAEAESRFLIGSAKQDLVEMRKELDSRKKKSPPPPPRAPVVSGAGQGMKVYIRGNPMTKGEDAPKGFLQVLATTTAPQPAPKDYTRLDLAKAISNPENPLTARVYVNRVWQGHFGKGLVNTPSNFGSLGSKPSHAELLDFLAAEFVKQGWSTKWLHRQIMLSSTYQLASDEEPANNKIDAGNVYLWRSSRHRLDIESWRDSLLNAADRLDTTMGGPTFNLHDASARRRTVYAKISRHELDGLLRLFDFPDANVTADKRTSTTVPQQQLFALNSEFMVIQAKAFAERIAKLGTTDEARVTAAYKLAYGRLPESRELELGLSFLKTPNKPEDKLTRWQQYAQALLAANEFMYVD